MAQISYWKQVKRLHDIYEYNLESTPLLEEKDILVKSIIEYIKDYQPGYDLVEIYSWICKIKDKHKIRTEEALIIVGQEIYDMEG